MSREHEPFVLFGVDQSYFTRKMSGYLDRAEYVQPGPER